MDRHKLRVFIGIHIPETIYPHFTNLQKATRQAVYDLPCKWVRAENWHLTLAFLGNLASASIAPLVVELEQRLAGYRAFDTHIGDIQWFPSPQKPRLIVAGIHLNARLLAIKIRTDMAAKIVGVIPDKRTFRPHITLARINKDNPNSPAKQLPLTQNSIPSLHVDRVTLFQSQQGADGSYYTPLHQFPLG